MIMLYLYVSLVATCGIFYVAGVQEFDQRQQGDLNVQVNLKDIQIVALVDSEDYVSYDYAYDYADFTVKPVHKPTTSTTTSSTTSSNNLMSNSTTDFNKTSVNIEEHTTAINLEEKKNTSLENSTPKISATTLNSTTVGSVELNNTKLENITPTNISQESTTSENSAALVSTLSRNLDGRVNQLRICSSQLLSSMSGRCRKRRISLLPFSMTRIQKTNNNP